MFWISISLILLVIVFIIPHINHPTRRWGKLNVIEYLFDLYSPIKKSKIMDGRSWVFNFKYTWEIIYHIKEKKLSIGCQTKTIKEWDYFFSDECFNWYSNKRSSWAFLLIERKYKLVRKKLVELYGENSI